LKEEAMSGNLWDALGAEAITKDLQARGYNVSQSQVEELLTRRYTRAGIVKLITLLGLVYGKGNLGIYLGQFIGYEHEYAIGVARILSKLKFSGLDPDTVYRLLSTDTGDEEDFSEDEVLQMLNNFCSIYKNDHENGAQEVKDAIDILLDQGFDITMTLNLADAFADYFQLMQQKILRNKYGQNYPNPDYKDTMEARLQCINVVISNLNNNKLNSKDYKYFDSPNHTQHSREMGLTDAEYKQKAMDFLKGQPLDDELQLTRPNGDILRWNEDTGEFGILQSDGNVKTYYNIGTDEDAWLYFLRQANRMGE